MKVMEGSKSRGFFRKTKSYSLAVTSMINASNPIDSEIRLINEAMINWFKNRETSCEALVFVYISNPDLHDQIIQRTHDLLNQDFAFAPLIKTLSVSLVLLDEKARKCKELKLGPSR